MSRFAEKGAAISGIGQSDIERKPRTPPFELAIRACEQAIADAGLSPADIDGAACWPATPSGATAGVAVASIPDVAASLGLKLNWWSGADMAAQLSPILEAAAAIAAGYATHVLCWRAVGERGTPIPAPEAAPPAVTPAAGVMEFLLPYRSPSAAIWVACHASTHMTRHGITREQLAQIALNQRRNAALNPKAIYRDPITLEDYLGARMIASPLTLLDCDIPSNATDSPPG